MRDIRWKIHSKILKIGTPKTIMVSLLKMEQFSLIVVKDADGMANNVDPDQTAPSGEV